MSSASAPISDSHSRSRARTVACGVDRRVQRHVQRWRRCAPLRRKQCDVVVVAGRPEQQFECLRTDAVDGSRRGVDDEAAGAGGDIRGQVGEFRGAGAQRPARTFDQAVGVQQDRVAHVEHFGAHRKTDAASQAGPRRTVPRTARSRRRSPAAAAGVRRCSTGIHPWRSRASRRTRWPTSIPAHVRGSGRPPRALR